MGVPFARPDCSGNELEYVREVLESGWLTTGAKAREFEERFAAEIGVTHALAVNSCTAALHLACEAAGIGPNSRVVVPSLTFTATAEVVRYLGGDVILADVDPSTGLLTPEILEELLDRSGPVDAVMPVHFAGRAVRMRSTPEGKGLLDVCRASGIKVIEDAAHAFPSRYECGEREIVGSLSGTTTCFSFYANKTMTTGEGGMIVTRDDEVAERAARMRLHGIDRDAWNRFTTASNRWEYDVIAAGFKYNLTDVAAAIGLAQLERAAEFRDQRANLVSMYRERLEGLAGITLPPVPDREDSHSWHLFCIQVDDQAGVSRNELIERLHDAEIGTSVHYKPLHRMTYWSNECDVDLLPGAERWWRGCLSLPLFTTMTSEDVEEVCTGLRNAIEDRTPVS